MKFSPTITLALALSAGAAVAQTMTAPGAAPPDSQQTAPSSSQAGWNLGQPSGAPTQPQATFGQAQPTSPTPSSAQAQPGLQAQPGAPPQAEPGAQARPGTQAGSGQAMQPAAGQTTAQPGDDQAMAPSAGQSMPIPGVQRSDQIRQAQERLSAMGLYNGPTDGQMDPNTRAAIANFQQQNGIRRSANLDQRTLDRLMASQTAGSGSSAPENASAPVRALGATPSPIGAGR